jgi:hypothetical protein
MVLDGLHRWASKPTNPDPPAAFFSTGCAFTREPSPLLVSGLRDVAAGDGASSKQPPLQTSPATMGLADPAPAAPVRAISRQPVTARHRWRRCCPRRMAPPARQRLCQVRRPSTCLNHRPPPRHRRAHCRAKKLAFDGHGAAARPMAPPAGSAPPPAGESAPLTQPSGADATRSGSPPAASRSPPVTESTVHSELGPAPQAASGRLAATSPSSLSPPRRMMPPPPSQHSTRRPEQGRALPSLPPNSTSSLSTRPPLLRARHPPYPLKPRLLFHRTRLLSTRSREGGARSNSDGRTMMARRPRMTTPPPTWTSLVAWQSRSLCPRCVPRIL